MQDRADQSSVLQGGAHCRRGVVHIDGVGMGWCFPVAHQVGGAGLEGVGALAGGDKGRTPGGAAGGVLAGRDIHAIGRAAPRPVDAQFHQRHAGGLILGLHVHDHVLVGQVGESGGVGAQRRDGRVIVYGDSLATALLYQLALVQEDVPHLRR